MTVSLSHDVSLYAERFDIVMDEHLLDEVFSRLDPEGNGKVPCPVE